jgi:hypothetical protein
MADKLLSQKPGEYSSKPPPGGGMKFTFKENRSGFDVNLDILNPSECCDLVGGKQMISEKLDVYYKKKEITMEILKKMMPSFSAPGDNIVKWTRIEAESKAKSDAAAAAAAATIKAEADALIEQEAKRAVLIKEMSDASVKKKVEIDNDRAQRAAAAKADLTDDEKKALRRQLSRSTHPGLAMQVAAERNAKYALL